jgi:hypothetical protein
MSQQHARRPNQSGEPSRRGSPAKRGPRDSWEPSEEVVAQRRGQRQRRPTTRTRLPREEAPVRSPFRGKGHTPAQSFTCGHCHRFIGPLPSGGHHRNHCPFCLYSRHVDDRVSGDRMSACGSQMAPIGAFQRPNGEHVVVHRCLGCGFERFNRIAADDDFDLVLALAVVPPRSARRTEDATHTPHERNAGE